MPTTLPFGQRTMQNGDTVLANNSTVPTGTRRIDLTLDLSQMVTGTVDENQVLLSGQRLTWRLDFSDGNFAILGCLGVGKDKQGVQQTNGTFSVTFAAPTPAGLKVTVTITVENGPFTTSGGTLVLT